MIDVNLNSPVDVRNAGTKVFTMKHYHISITRIIAFNLKFIVSLVIHIFHFLHRKISMYKSQCILYSQYSSFLRIYICYPPLEIIS